MRMKNLKTITLILLFISGVALLSCSHEPELMPGTPDVCFERDVMLIINTNCNVPGCHGTGEAKSLGTYDEIYKLVTPGKPMASKLHKVITANSSLGNLMPPKPKARLSSAQIDILSLWILQGAKNNQCK